MFKQLSVFDDLTESSPSTVLDLLKVHFEIQRLLPSSWIFSYYKHFGRDHDYSLSSYVCALLIQKLFHPHRCSITADFKCLSRA